MWRGRPRPRLVSAENHHVARAALARGLFRRFFPKPSVIPGIAYEPFSDRVLATGASELSGFASEDARVRLEATAVGEGARAT